jgi:pimeloyl-ACP methyl ester carboxylesterase
MSDSSVASLRAAAEGRAAKERYEASGAEYDPEMFTPEDHAALSGAWSWVLDVVNPAVAAGPGGLIDDDLAFVAPWGFDPARVVAPTLFLLGGCDRVVPSSHGEWLARRCPSAERGGHGVAPGAGRRRLSHAWRSCQSRPETAILTLFSRVRGRGILGKSHPGSCI